MPVLVSDNTENRCFLDTTFVRMLLPQLRKQVSIIGEDLQPVEFSGKAEIFHNFLHKFEDVKHLPFYSN